MSGASVFTAGNPRGVLSSFAFPSSVGFGRSVLEEGVEVEPKKELHQVRRLLRRAHVREEGEEEGACLETRARRWRTAAAGGLIVAPASA